MLFFNTYVKLNIESSDKMRRGFTLIELLAVIVILAIIALIAVPIVVNIINDSKKESQEESIKLYAKAIENGLLNYLLKYPNDREITLDKIKGYINYNGQKIECKTVQMNEKGKIYLTNCSINDVEVEYEYGDLIKPIVELPQGLTPIIYDGDNWKVIDENDSNWYDYDNQKWANAVVLKSNSTKTVGDIVTIEGNDSDVLMIYVWIPRFEYKIEGQYGKHLDGTDGTQNFPGEIKINFVSKNVITANEGYHLHPAFKFGDEEKTGFWIGKFEISHMTKSQGNSQFDNSSDLNCTTNNCDEAQYLRVLPNRPSLRYNFVSNFWYGIKSIENTNLFVLRDVDVHMIKNSEWAAVAYLSQSKYGKYGNSNYEGAQKEVYINNSSSYYTGRSGGNSGGNTAIKDTYTDQTSTIQYNNYGFYTYDGYLLNYNTNTKTETRDIKKGTGASTTGNIYGVYDMSGGANEYVMGVYKFARNSSDYFFEDIFSMDKKYYNIYTTTIATTACDNDICYGEGLSETLNWYCSNSSIMPYSTTNHPWLSRGNNYSSKCSIFRFSENSGSNMLSTTRIVIS